jgi:GNAT superfamily N-acetyltransferase
MKKLFVLDKDREDDYSKELLYALEKAKATVPDVEFIYLDQLRLSLLQEKHVDVVISNGMTPEWHYTLKGLGCVSIVFDVQDTYVPLSDIVIDPKANNKIGNFGTSDYSLLDNPNFDFNDISNLVKKLAWDTDFFGFGIGYISSRNLTDNIYNKVHKFAVDNDVRVLEYLCNCHDQESVRVAEKQDFHFVDIRLTFEITPKPIHEEMPDGFTMGVAQPSHIKELRRLSSNLYKNSRYYFDGNFDPEKVDEFYQSWTEKAVLGTFDNVCYCVFKDDKPVGFSTLRFHDAVSANFGLSGFLPEFQGLGLARKVFNHSINACAERGIKKLFTVTQGRNYGSQRLFQSVGFKTYSTELWYHKWLS